MVMKYEKSRRQVLGRAFAQRMYQYQTVSSSYIMPHVSFLVRLFAYRKNIVRAKRAFRFVVSSGYMWTDT